MKSTRPNLMVVDDEPEVLRSVQDLFRMEYRVLTFTRGEEALERLRHEDIPVVLSDQRMPEMTGVEFLQRAQQISPDTVRLLFTGYSDIKAVIDAINQGNVFRYIDKPWDAEELSGIIRQALEHHNLVSENRRMMEELRRTNSQLVEADRVKTAFIEVASHELNTPLAVVMGLTELWKIQEGPTASPASRSWIDRMDAATKRLASIVERMLRLLQTDRFDDSLDFQATDVEDLIDQVVAEMKPFLESRHQRVEVEVESGGVVAEVEPRMIRDALTNLVVNAIKFSPDDSVIRIIASYAGPEMARIVVQDSGVGISAADRRHLFEPFFTCYDTMHHSSGQFQFGKRGIGLGLHMVKTFVELNGGSVEEVKSTPNEGTTFSILLPRRQRVLRAALGAM